MLVRVCHGGDHKLNVKAVGYGSATPGKTARQVPKAMAVKIAGSSAAPTAIAAEKKNFRGKTMVLQNLARMLEKSTKIRPRDTELRIELHKPTKTMIVKVVDSKTGEVIMELPPEKMLNLSVDLQELIGVLLDRKG